MTTRNPLGFAILGTGMVADYHRQAIQANEAAGARLVAVSHHDPARFDEISARFGVPCFSPDELLAHAEVDAVCICTPSGQHAAQAIAAAKAGKHVLVEKPMALSLADADAMIWACEEAGVRLGFVLQRRAEPLFRRVKEALGAGDLGEPTLAAVSLPYLRPQGYYDQADWRGTWALDGGGVLMNQGIHPVDLLVWYLGDPTEAQAVAGHAAPKRRGRGQLTACLRFQSGALATITTTAAPGFAHRLEVYGTEGGIQLEGEGVSRWQLTGTASVAPLETAGAAGAGSGGDPRGIEPTGHINLLRNFIRSILGGRAPEVDGHEGRRSLAVVLAVHRAAGIGPEGSQR